jgi:hypothetical protein
MIEYAVEIFCHPYRFQASVKHSAFEETDIRFSRITLGWKEKCVMITVYHDDTMAHLEGVSYKELCGFNMEINTHLEPGKGTIKMLKAAFKFAAQQFPHVIGFTLTDTSSVTCDHGIKIPLYYFSLAKYGKTWYQRNLDATPQRTSYVQSIANMNTTFNGPKQTSFSEFWKEHIAPNSKKIRIRESLLRETLENIYDTSTTLREFIHRLDSQFDCIIFDEWLADLVEAHCTIPFNQAKWVVHVNTVNGWGFDLRIEHIEKTHFNADHVQTIIQHGGVQWFFPYGNNQNRVKTD